VTSTSAPSFYNALNYFTSSIWDSNGSEEAHSQEGGSAIPTYGSSPPPAKHSPEKRKRFISKDEEDFLEILSDVVSDVVADEVNESPSKRFPSNIFDAPADLSDSDEEESNPHESDVVKLLADAPAYQVYLEVQEKRMASTRPLTVVASELDLWAHNAIKSMQITLEDTTDVGHLSEEEFNKRMGSLDEVLSQFSHDFDSDLSVPFCLSRTEPGAPEMDIGPSEYLDRNYSFQNLVDELEPNFRGDMHNISSDTDESMDHSRFILDHVVPSLITPPNSNQYGKLLETPPSTHLSRSSVSSSIADPDSSAESMPLATSNPPCTLRYMKNIVAHNLELARENEELRRKLKYLQENRGGENLPSSPL